MGKLATCYPSYVNNFPHGGGRFIVEGVGYDATIVGGKVVYASAEFSKLAPPQLSVSPDWSPVKHYGGYQQPEDGTAGEPKPKQVACSAIEHSGGHSASRWVLSDAGMWSLGCDCFAF